MKKIHIKEKGWIHAEFRTADRMEWVLLLNTIKRIPGRLFEKNIKMWAVPDNEESRKILNAAGFPVEAVPTQPVEEEQPYEPEWLNLKIPVFPGKELLRPYQIDALKFLHHRKGRGLIADEMGTGKTVQSLSYAKMKQGLRPILMIVTASTKIQWQREYIKWLGEDNVYILSGKKPYKLSPGASYIINWDILACWKKELDAHKFKLLIGDEIQAIANAGTQRTRACMSLGKKISKFIALSGTPVKSRPRQFFSCLNMIDPDKFPNRQKFLIRYCDPQYDGFTIKYDGLSNSNELRNKARPLMIRRRKKDVLKDLPAKIRTVVPIELKDWTKYESQLQTIRNSFGVDRNVQLGKLSRTSFTEKKDVITTWIQEFLQTGEKLLVFAYHRPVVNFIHESFKYTAVKIMGGITGKAREKAIQEFINGDKNLMVANILAAGVGIDGLQKSCSNAAVVEFPANPGDLFQAEDRLHRIGQMSQVNIYYLAGIGTIDEIHIDNLDTKTEMTSRVVDGETDQDDLINKILEKALDYKHQRDK